MLNRRNLLKTGFYEGITIHQAVRLDGVVLDIHPQPQQPLIEVGIDRGSVEFGRLDSSIFVGEIHVARGSLASAIAQELFLMEEETEFEFLYHFDDVDECKSYLLEEAWCETPEDEALIEATRGLLSQGQGDILMRVPVRAARLRRLRSRS